MIKIEQSVTINQHGEKFSWNENMTFVGKVSGDGETAMFRVERALTGQSLKKGSQLQNMLDMLKSRRQFTPRLQAEAQRRSQPVPKIRLLN